MSKLEQFTAELVDKLLSERFQQKDLYSGPVEIDGRVPMYAGGEFEPGKRYQRGDLITITGLGLFLCRRSSIADPRTNSGDWMNVLINVGGGGGRLGGSISSVLDALSDVAITNLQDGQVLMYDASQSMWINAFPPLPPQPVTNLAYIDASTTGLDNNISTASEGILLRMTGAVDPLSVPANFVTYKRNGITNTMAASFSQFANATTAPYSGFMIDRPVSGWPLTDDGIYTVDISAFSSSGIAIANPQQLLIATTFIAPAFTYTSDSVPDADGYVDGNDVWTLVFSEPVDVSTVGNVVDAAGNNFPVTKSVVGNNLLITPVGGWTAVGDNFSLSLAGLMSATGTVIQPASTQTITHRRIVNKTAHTPPAGTSLTGSAALGVTFNYAIAIGSMPLPTEGGTSKAGTWTASADGKTLTFAPSSPWAGGASVVLSWAGAADSMGNVVTNPGTETYTVNAFTKMAHAPATNLTASVPLSVTFNVPPNAGSMPSVLQNGLGMPGSWSAAGNVATFTPSTPWSTNGATVVVSWNGATSASGLVVTNPGTQNFQTWTRMFFTSSNPANNGFIGNNSVVYLTFDQPIDATTLPVARTAAGSGVPGTWSASGNTAMWTPSSPMAGGLTITFSYVGAFSTNGTPLSNPGNIKATVVNPITLTAFYPIDLGPGSYMTSTSTIEMQFTSQPDPATLPDVMDKQGSGLFFTPKAGSWAVTGNNAIFTPATPWNVGGTGGIVNLSSGGVKNLAGEAITNPAQYLRQYAA